MKFTLQRKDCVVTVQNPFFKAVSANGVITIETYHDAIKQGYDDTIKVHKKTISFLRKLVFKISINELWPISSVGGKTILKYARRKKAKTYFINGLANPLYPDTIFEIDVKETFVLMDNIPVTDSRRYLRLENTINEGILLTPIQRIHLDMKVINPVKSVDIKLDLKDLENPSTNEKDWDNAVKKVNGNIIGYVGIDAIDKDELVALNQIEKAWLAESVVDKGSLISPELIEAVNSSTNFHKVTSNLIKLFDAKKYSFKLFGHHSSTITELSVNNACSVFYIRAYDLMGDKYQLSFSTVEGIRNNLKVYQKIEF